MNCGVTIVALNCFNIFHATQGNVHNLHNKQKNVTNKQSPEKNLYIMSYDGVYPNPKTYLFIKNNKMRFCYSSSLKTHTIHIAVNICYKILGPFEETNL